MIVGCDTQMGCCWGYGCSKSQTKKFYKNFFIGDGTGNPNARKRKKEEARGKKKERKDFSCIAS